jgi:protoheme IX farnesyltransferase
VQSTNPIVATAIAPTSSVADYFTLMKPGVMALVVFTGATGLWLAPASVHPFLQLLAIFAIALGSGAGAVLNMVYDRDIDRIMRRTSSRPIPAGRITPDDALAFGLMLTVASVGLMGLALNWVAAAWLGFAIFFYAVIYTMLLKRHTPQNIVIGGAAGAFPAVIGWAAATGDAFALYPWLLFLIVFFWTPSHFWALALYRHDDYRTANVPMLPVIHGETYTKRAIFFYSLLLVISSFTPMVLTNAGLIYGVAAAALGTQYIIHAWRVLHSDDPKVAMRLFGFSILYLFLLFGALLADHALLLFNLV